MLLRDLRQNAERMVYRVAGLPVAISAAVGGLDDPLHLAFSDFYWHPETWFERAQLGAAMILWPIVLFGASVWFTWLSGLAVRRRHGKSLTAQLREQVRLYFSDGVLAPWYYIFSLHDEGASRARTFIHRFETKTCYFRLLKRKCGTPLQNKVRFAEYCEQRGIRSIETLMELNGEDPGQVLPDFDLFVKPASERGGRGAQRWDSVAPSTFEGPGGERLGGADLLARLVAQSGKRPLIVQLRLRPHSDLVALTAGALPTVRVLTCLNTENEPEIMAAMIRTSFGENRTVDNLHAGGLGALVDLQSGKLGKASNLGMDARLGWTSTHPDTGARIEGTVVPCWNEAKVRAIQAHRAFSDRTVVGWDIAMLDDGPIFVEGNGNPDLDILQRYMRTGFREHRLATLLAHHLRERGLVTE